MTYADLDEGFRDTYLSVDLDYWMACPEEHVGEGARSLRGRDPLDVMMSKFLASVLKHAPQVVLVTHHDQITPYVNGVFNVPLGKIINVDFHSDLPDWGHELPFPALNEGTWGLYVAMPHTKIFEWRSGSDRDMSCRRCCSDPSDPAHDPFHVPVLSAYHKAVHKLGLRGIPWHRLAGAAIVVSPDWWFSSSETCGSLDAKGMKLSRQVLGLKTWPMNTYKKVRVLKGTPVPDAGFQERLALAYNAEQW